MRRGAATTSRALAEQSTASNQVSKETERFAKMVVGVNKAMAEQTVAATEINKVVDGMRQQSDQVARAMSEQAQAGKDINQASHEVSRQIEKITRTNREHSLGSETILNAIFEIRKITERNAGEVKQTQDSAVNLLESAQTLAEIMDRLAARKQLANGNGRSAGNLKKSEPKAGGTRKQSLPTSANKTTRNR
jgi:methyl-accepting chemotaxis protein